MSDLPRLKLYSTGDEIGRFVVDMCLRPGERRAIYEAHEKEDHDTKAQIIVVPRNSRDVLNEVRVLKAAEHGAVPELLHFGLSKDRQGVWLATRWFDGDPLSDRMIYDRPDWKETATAFCEISKALAHLHEREFFHRDINPQKILIGRHGEAQLIGYELALDKSELAGAEDAALGAVAYAAPEIIADRTAHDVRAEIYSLGVVLYEALTGQPAFPAALMGDADEAQRMQHWKTRTDPLDPGPEYPDWLRKLVQRSTHPDPDKRFEDMAAFADWLEVARAAWELRKPEADARTEEVSLAPPPAILLAAPSIAKEALPEAPEEDMVAELPAPANNTGAIALLFGGAAASGGVLGALTAVGFLVLQNTAM